MGVIEVEWEQIVTDLVRVGLAFAFALPIAWERGRGRASVGWLLAARPRAAGLGVALFAASDRLLDLDGSRGDLASPRPDSQGTTR